MVDDIFYLQDQGNVMLRSEKERDGKRNWTGRKKLKISGSDSLCYYNAKILKF